MSRQTLSRIPKEINHIFKVYETASQVYRPYDDKLVSQFVDKTSLYYEMFNRRKLLSTSGKTPIFNPLDFPPVTRDIVLKVFELPLQLEKKLTLPLDPAGETRNDISEYQPIYSEWHKTAKNFSDYQARVLSQFASYYSPLKEATGPISQKSMDWYGKLLAHTPVIFFLRQKQRLMAESSLRGINYPLEALRSKLELVCTPYATDRNIDKRIRNYHLTNLVSTDIFKLAVAKETISGQNDEDKLCKYLCDLHKPEVLPGNDQDIVTKYPLHQIESTLLETDAISRLPEIFPYDIKYNDLYMLTIERPVLRDNHHALLELVGNQEHFEVVATRLLRVEALETELETEPEPETSTQDVPTYEQLLKWAEKQHTTTTLNHVTQILEQIGEWGLVAVEENSSSSAFYVFREDQ